MQQNEIHDQYRGKERRRSQSEYAGEDRRRRAQGFDDPLVGASEANPATDRAPAKDPQEERAIRMHRTQDDIH
jgi:hypothetical protein